MSEVKLHLFNINDSKFNDLFSSCLNDNDKIKTLSSYLKKKYIGEYHSNEFGKPISSNIKFNISHSGPYIVLVTTNDREIGVDIEVKKDISDKLKEYVRHTNESIETNIDFFKLWTKKEAILKCSGKGIDRRLNEIDTSGTSDIVYLDNKLYRYVIIDNNDYVISIVLEGEENFMVTYSHH